MKHACAILAFTLALCLSIPTPAPAFYTRGTITRDIAYDRLAVSKPPAGLTTYRPRVTGLLVNKTRDKIFISTQMAFCNVFGEHLATLTLRCTLPPMKKTSFGKITAQKAPATLKDAHHVEWTVLRIRKN
ncbi:hypothetical protein [Desulfoluna sp.]|uniref:hypothetical protein n=1 Tax=Desulfoluna sp. TaxID=2045199 RepID=UPI00263214C7|nr:hypothetical protein [Desulfoluna sp.]